MDQAGPSDGFLDQAATTLTTGETVRHVERALKELAARSAEHRTQQEHWGRAMTEAETIHATVKAILAERSRVEADATREDDHSGSRELVWPSQRRREPIVLEHHVLRRAPRSPAPHDRRR